VLHKGLLEFLASGEAKDERSLGGEPALDVGG
jgi:hypothetical protein